MHACVHVFLLSKTTCNLLEQERNIIIEQTRMYPVVNKNTRTRGAHVSLFDKPIYLKIFENAKWCIMHRTIHHESKRACTQSSMHACVHACSHDASMHPSMPACLHAGVHASTASTCPPIMHHASAPPPPWPRPQRTMPPARIQYIYMHIYVYMCIYIYIYPPPSSGARALSHSDPLIPSNPANSNQQLPQYLATGHHRLPSLPATYIARCRLPYGTILKE